jgi:1-phosphofructokinase family hexose kinase
MKSPRILCVSANPAIDRRIRLRQLQLAAVNRAEKVDPQAGGKAAHVAFAAKTLGAEVIWIGFLGGPEGEACYRGIAARGISAIAVSIHGRTRTNLELIDAQTGDVTEVLEPGPVITADEVSLFKKQFQAQLVEQPVVVISGSLPRGMPCSFYGELITAVRNAGSRTVLDTSGQALSEALASKPDVIKPNRQEASALLGRNVGTIAEAVGAAEELRERGVSTPIISLGSEGAVVMADGRVLHGMPPKIIPKSTVGSGDSFLAGWSFAEAQGMEAGECLRTAIACGAANCLADSPANFSLATMLEIRQQVEIREL